MAGQGVTRRRALYLAMALITGARADATDGGDLIDTGRNIYELNRGEAPIMVRLEGGTWQDAAPAQACRACHGDSGEGASEGTINAPPLASLALQTPQEWRTWLDNALLRHHAANGRPLHAAMPRYRLSSQDSTALIAYLRALPQSATPGVGHDRVTIRVVSNRSGLSKAGAQALTTQLDTLARTTNDAGGLFGRHIDFVQRDDTAPALLDLAWDIADSPSLSPTLTLRAGIRQPSDIVTCGSVDPTDTDGVRALVLWSEQQGAPAVIAGEEASLAAETVILPRTAAVLPSDLGMVKTLYVSPDQAQHWPSGKPPADIRSYAPGDMDKRTAAARSLMAQGVQAPRDAMIIAVYLEGAATVIEGLKTSGRRLRRMAFCDTVRTLSRSRQSVSVMWGRDVVVIPATM